MVKIILNKAVSSQQSAFSFFRRILRRAVTQNLIQTPQTGQTGKNKFHPDGQAVAEHLKCHFERSEKSYNVNKYNIPTIRLLQIKILTTNYANIHEKTYKIFE